MPMPHSAKGALACRRVGDVDPASAKSQPFFAAEFGFKRALGHEGAIPNVNVINIDPVAAGPAVVSAQDRDRDGVRASDQAA